MRVAASFKYVFHIYDVPLVFQCGARLGENSGGEDGDAASALGLPLGEDNMGEPQV